MYGYFHSERDYKRYLRKEKKERMKYRKEEEQRKDILVKKNISVLKLLIYSFCGLIVTIFDFLFIKIPNGQIYANIIRLFCLLGIIKNFIEILFFEFFYRKGVK